MEMHVVCIAAVHVTYTGFRRHNIAVYMTLVAECPVAYKLPMHGVCKPSSHIIHMDM